MSLRILNDFNDTLHYYCYFRSVKYDVNINTDLCDSIDLKNTYYIVTDVCVRVGV